MMETKRIYIGGLFSGVTKEDIAEKFAHFGKVSKVDIKQKKNTLEEAVKTFAYVNIDIVGDNLNKCLGTFNKSRWKGSQLKLQLAKESFIDRLQVERDHPEEIPVKPRKVKKSSYHNPLENLPDATDFHLKGATPGTLIEGEKNWVVGKYGRVLPIVYIRRQDKKKIIKVDPSKFCHNIKLYKDDATSDIKQVAKSLTWEMTDIKSDNYLRRQGVFPDWQPPKKIKKVQELTKNVKTVQELTKNVKTVQELTKNVKTVQELTKNVKTVQELTKNVKTVQELTKNVKTVQELTKNVKTVQELTKNVKTVQELTKNVKTVQELTKNVKTVQELTKNVKTVEDVFNISGALHGCLSVCDDDTEMEVVSSERRNKKPVQFYLKTKNDDSDGDSISSTNTDDIIAAAKDNRVNAVRDWSSSDEDSANVETEAVSVDVKPNIFVKTEQNSALNMKKMVNESSNKVKSKLKNMVPEEDASSVRKEPKKENVNSKQTKKNSINVKNEIQTDNVKSEGQSKTGDCSKSEHVIASKEINFVECSTIKQNRQLLPKSKVQSTDDILAELMSGNLSDSDSNDNFSRKKKKQKRKQWKPPEFKGTSFLAGVTDSSICEDSDLSKIHRLSENQGNTVNTISNLNIKSQKKCVKTKILMKEPNVTVARKVDRDNPADISSSAKTLSQPDQGKLQSDAESDESRSTDEIIAYSKSNAEKDSSHSAKFTAVKLKSGKNQSFVSERLMLLNEFASGMNLSEKSVKTTRDDSDEYDSEDYEKVLAEQSVAKVESKHKIKDDLKQSVTKKTEPPAAKLEKKMISKVPSSMDSKSQAAVPREETLTKGKDDDGRIVGKDIDKRKDKKLLAKQSVAKVESKHKSKDDLKQSVTKETEPRTTKLEKKMISKVPYSMDSKSQAAVPLVETLTKGKDDDGRIVGKDIDKRKDKKLLAKQSVAKVESKCKIKDDLKQSVTKETEPRATKLEKKMISKVQLTMDSKSQAALPCEEAMTKGKDNDGKKVGEDIVKIKDKKLLRKDGTLKPGNKKVSDNEKRMESLKQKVEENRSQKEAIRKALSSVDKPSKFMNKKIIFDSDEDQDETDGPSDEVIGQSDDSESEESEEETENRKKKNAAELFDNSDKSDDDTETNSQDDFRVRPQFEGAKGNKLMALQSRYANDERFKLNENFMESDSDEENKDVSCLAQPDDEKSRSLKILEAVVGYRLRGMQGKEKKQFKDVAALHFDPAREDHSRFEIKSDSKSAKRKKKSMPLEEKSGDIIKQQEPASDNEEDVIDPTPKVSAERFYEVTSSIKEGFKSNDGFSLLAAFGDDENDKTGEGQGIDHDEPMKKPFLFSSQQAFDSSDDEEETIIKVPAEENMEAESGETKTVIFPAKKATFFFTENDDRIKEGIQYFKRPVGLETVHEMWQSKRPDLVEAYRQKRKKMLRKQKDQQRQKSGQQRRSSQWKKK